MHDLMLFTESKSFGKNIYHSVSSSWFHLDNKKKYFYMSADVY